MYNFDHFVSVTRSIYLRFSIQDCDYVFVFTYNFCYCHHSIVLFIYNERASFRIDFFLFTRKKKGIKRKKERKKNVKNDGIHNPYIYIYIYIKALYLINRIQYPLLFA